MLVRLNVSGLWILRLILGRYRSTQSKVIPLDQRAVDGSVISEFWIFQSLVSPRNRVLRAWFYLTKLLPNLYLSKRLN
jgi:hypothetical protein